MRQPGVARWLTFTLVGLLALVPAAAAAQGTGAGAAAGAAGSGPGPYVSATGVATVAGNAAPQAAGPQMLNVGIRAQVQGGDIQAAVQQATQKVGAVEAALEKAGIDPSAIRVQNFNIGPQYGLAIPAMGYASGSAYGGGSSVSGGGAAGGGGGGSATTTPAVPLPPTRTPTPSHSAIPSPVPPELSGYTVNEGLQVSVSGLDQLAAAMSAAIGAGATSVNTFTQCCMQTGSPPTGDALSSAIGEATAAAKAEAQAAARAAGVTLGTLHALTVQPPFQQGPFGPRMAPAWRVQVTVSYDIGS